MKKLAILLLFVFTVVMSVACGCDGTKSSNRGSKIEVESVQTEALEEDHSDPKNPDGPEKGEKCPDGKCPRPHRPHIGHHKRLPRPKSAYRKHN